MKKWMIVATIVAVLSMAMFAACGGEEESDDDASITVPNVEIFDKASGIILVTWSGSSKYAYDVYVQGGDMTNGIVDATGGRDTYPGYNFLKYDLEGDEWVESNNDGPPENWAIQVDLSSVSEEWFSIGVAAVNPGGYPSVNGRSSWTPYYKVSAYKD
jgi:hypothetical protein